MEIGIYFYVVVLILLIAIYSYFTNPFVKFTLIKDPFKEYNLESRHIIQTHKIHVRKIFLFKYLALIKAGWHIVFSSLIFKKKSRGQTVEEIIKDIHKLRFNPKNSFLISGDHFSVLYPRSLGIFYHTMLDTRIPSDEEDWLNRQLIYTKTLIYALSVFEQAGRLSTTVVPLTQKSVALINIYAYPSDTLYSLLFAIANTLNTKFIFNIYPFKNEVVNKLETDNSGNLILKKYRNSLKKHFYEYKKYVFDSDTGLIKKNIKLSGTKDIAKRQSSFYDNVIFYKTVELVKTLGIADIEKKFLINLKTLIIKQFWDKDQGYFIEDRSTKARIEKWYSSDWLIAYQTGFLKLESKNDLEMLTRSVDYIIKNKVDEPFPICYHKEKRLFQLYLPVRLGAPFYGSTVIWSHWGIEYIKLLFHLYVYTKNKLYLERGQKFLKQYRKNILINKCYPEVYDPIGKPYRHRAYKSVHQTGWIINFEQAEAMYKSLKKFS